MIWLWITVSWIEVVYTEHINESFLESYKRLDKLCRETYRSEKGVTSYIDDMKSASTYESWQIPDWDTDLRQLIDLRHIRNQLTHDVGTLHMPMCKQSDIDWLEDFHSRILRTTDPIAMLAKRKLVKQQVPKSAPKQQNTVARRTAAPAAKSSSGCLTAFLSALCIFLGIVFAILLFFIS